MAITTLSDAELKALPKELRDKMLSIQNSAVLLEKVSEGKLSLKVSEKGAVSVYGMGRWPVTLYKEQMLRLLDYGATIREFIAGHPELKTKLQAAVEGLEGEKVNGNGNGSK